MLPNLLKHSFLVNKSKNVALTNNIQIHSSCSSEETVLLSYEYSLYGNLTTIKICHIAVLMSQKQSFSLDAPAKKFFACQLLHCSSSVKAATDLWMYSDSNRKIFFSQVWVQGIVVLVSEDGDDLFLDDGTGIIEANGITKIVKDLFIQKGDYRFSLTFDLTLSLPRPTYRFNSV